MEKSITSIMRLPKHRDENFNIKNSASSSKIKPPKDH